MTDKFTSLITVSVALAAALTLGSEQALAACTPDIYPRTDTPYITRCDDDQDIRIDLNDEDITATVSGIRGRGIVGISEGDPSGDVTINVQGGRVKTSGRSSPAIQALSKNGDVTINVQGVSITTDSTTDPRQDRPSSGITAVINDPRADSPDGKVSVTAKDVTILTSGGRGSHGIYGYNSSKRTDNPDADTDIDIDIEDSSITTEGSLAHGILGEHGGDGNVNIDVRGSHITSGDYHGIYGFRGLLGDRADTTGDINIDARDSSITTKANLGHGIYARNEGITKTIYDYTVEDYVSRLVNGYATGDINIDVQGVTITTESTDVDSDTLSTESHGIYGHHLGEGDINIDVQDGSTITTKGVNSHGIYGYHEDVLGDGTPGSNGDIAIGVRDSTITTIGQGSHGILAEHDSGMGSINILVNRGTIHASGTGASGVRVGLLNADGEVTRAGGLDEDGYRKQTVTVNGSVMGNAAGIFLAGGGRVIIGPRGSVGAVSGIAILATGDTPATDPMDPPIKPKLRVDLNLGGRKVAEAIGDDWIINDGGETTIAVNNIVLHEGATGISGLTAPNGAWNVRMREHGVTVDNRADPDPANWMITESTDATPIIAGRDFSTQDFTETRFIEEYAPRAALYEVLPDFMLRMQNWEPTRPRLFLPESPVYIRLLESTGSQEFKHSTVNANYDADRFAVEVGVNIPVSEDFNIGASAHHVTGSAEVYSPVNGGDIDVTGAGLSVDAYWSSENDYYATGRFSLTDYDIDLSSNTIGRLKSNGDAYGQSLHVETGRRMTLSENLHWTPRAWLGHTRISVDKFTDAVDSRVSFPDTDRLTGGFGVLAETVRTEYGGELLLRGSLGFEQKLGGSKTVTLVSGERLSAEPEKGSVLLSLGGAWHKGPFTYSAELSTRQDLHSGGEDYSGVIHMGMHF